MVRSNGALGAAALITAISAMLIGCVDPHTICGLGGQQIWVHLKSPPSNAGELRAMAASKITILSPAGEREYWFENSQHHIQLCYSSPQQFGVDGNYNHRSTEFWKDNGGLRVADRSQIWIY